MFNIIHHRRLSETGANLKPRLGANFLRPLRSCGGFLRPPSLSKAPDAMQTAFCHRADAVFSNILSLICGNESFCRGFVSCAAVSAAVSFQIMLKQYTKRD